MNTKNETKKAVSRTRIQALNGLYQTLYQTTIHSTWTPDRREMWCHLETGTLQEVKLC